MDSNAQPQSGQEVKPGAATPPVPELPTPQATNDQTPAQESPTNEAPTPANDQPQISSVNSFDEEPVMQWTAAEFLAHDKSTNWYLALIGGAVVLAALVYLLTKDKIATVVVLVAAVALGGVANRKPREVPYALFRDAIQIDQKIFDYAQFRSFSVGDEGHLATIALLPHKRFGQVKSLYFDPNDEAMIVDFIATHLPLERRSLDPIDTLMKKIRF